MVEIDLLVTHQLIIQLNKGKITTQSYKRLEGIKEELTTEEQKEFLSEILQYALEPNDLGAIVKQEHTGIGNKTISSHKELTKNLKNYIIISNAIQPYNQKGSTFIFIDSDMGNKETTYGLIAKTITTI